MIRAHSIGLAVRRYPQRVALASGNARATSAAARPALRHRHGTQPQLGEHTDEVLCERGLDTKDVEA
jgi:hypothetical protein